MSSSEEEWVKAAMSDDTMVVNLLIHLHSSSVPPPSLNSVTSSTFPFKWSIRQRRSNSKPAVVSVTTTNMKSNMNPDINKKETHHRASPTTPLSWSGATSPSAGSGPDDVTRSKINGDGEKHTTFKKSSRKKKTLAELKDDENSLLKERKELKRELALLHTNLEKQRVSNEKLKRMKIEFQPLPDREMKLVSPFIPPIISTNNVTLQFSTSNSSPKQNEDDSKFVLPDLNMPFEEEVRSDIMCGVS